MIRILFVALLVAVCGSIATANTFTVANTNDSGSGSLRQAITDANNNAGTDMITFNILGGGVHTVTPATTLPFILVPVRLGAVGPTGI